MYQPDPSLDLVLERVVDVPPHLVWQAWTTPELIKRWFTPKPWQTTECKIDLRPGGIFRTVMRGPDGEEFAGDGCILEVAENVRLVWTTAMGPGFRPSVTGGETSGEGFIFTAVISMEPRGAGTLYTAHVMHADEGARKKHEAMGFHDGWGAALDQLVAMVKENLA